MYDVKSNLLILHFYYFLDEPYVGKYSATFLDFYTQDARYGMLQVCEISGPKSDLNECAALPRPCPVLMTVKPL